jgi:hypothetical protein
MTTDTRMTLIAKYLGTLHHFRQSWAPEIATRITATKKAFYSLGAFWWQKGISWEIKKLVFNQHVVSTATSGLTSQILPKSAYDKLDSIICRFARKAMHGKAHYATDEGLETEKHHAMSNTAVLQWWRTAPTETEIRAQRLKWWQRLVDKPERNLQVICALFGRCEFEDHDQIDDNGQVQASATPYAKQFANDINSIADCDEFEALRDDIAGSVTNLFTNREISKRFA